MNLSAHSEHEHTLIGTYKKYINTKRKQSEINQVQMPRERKTKCEIYVAFIQNVNKKKEKLHLE